MAGRRAKDEKEANALRTHARELLDSGGGRNGPNEEDSPAAASNDRRVLNINAAVLNKSDSHIL